MAEAMERDGAMGKIDLNNEDEIALAVAKGDPEEGDEE
jgi:hypothetical protein